jgi:DNA-binding transcriptional ArsR family regulator
MSAKMKSPLDPAAAELIARRFQALSEPNRLRILDQLRSRGEVSVGEITTALGTSQQNVSKHLAALYDEGFVGRRKAGTSTLYRISDPAVLELCDQICAGIEARLIELGAVLTG